MTSWQQFRSTYVCPTTGSLLPSYVDCSKIVVDVRKASGWTDSNVSSKAFYTETTHTYCTGNTSDIVIVRVGYAMPVYLSILAMNNMSNAGMYKVTEGQTNISGSMSHLIVATSVFRNEPFPGVTPMTGC